MKIATKKRTRPSNNRGINQSTKSGPKSSHSVGFGMKSRVGMTPSKDRRETLEEEYSRLFDVPATLHQNFYSDDYNLQQPSALKYVPSTTNPDAEI